MTEHKDNIWCISGQMYVKLPEAAYDVSLLSEGIEITPCEGCAHKGHLKTTVRIDSEVNLDKLASVARRPKITHSVQVFEYLGKEHVQCTCNCYAETAKE